MQNQQQQFPPQQNIGQNYQQPQQNIGQNFQQPQGQNI